MKGESNESKSLGAGLVVRTPRNATHVALVSSHVTHSLYKATTGSSSFTQNQIDFNMMIVSSLITFLFLSLRLVCLLSGSHAFTSANVAIVGRSQQQPSPCVELFEKKKDGYRFGDISRGIIGKFKKDVNSLTGKETYEFGKNVYSRISFDTCDSQLISTFHFHQATLRDGWIKRDEVK